MLVYKSIYPRHVATLEVSNNGKLISHEKNIVDPEYALYKCSRALIINIEEKNNLGEKIKYVKEYTNYEDKTYELDTIIEDFFCFKTKEQAIMCHFLPKTGTRRQWHSNGRLSCEFKYDENYDAHGMCREWHPSGKLKEESMNKNGKYNGVCREWYDNGQLKMECVKEGEDIIGETHTWHKNSRLRSKGKKYWHENGQLCIPLELNRFQSTEDQKEQFCTTCGYTKTKMKYKMMMYIFILSIICNLYQFW